jgi:hypothetical protein
MLAEVDNGDFVAVGVVRVIMGVLVVVIGGRRSRKRAEEFILTRLCPSSR